MKCHKKDTKMHYYYAKLKCMIIKSQRLTSQSSWRVLLCLREILSFIVACVRKLFPCFLFFFFSFMVSVTYRALGKLVIFLYFSRSGSFFPYPCLISASRRVKHFKKIPNSSNMEYFWRNQEGTCPLSPSHGFASA